MTRMRFRRMPAIAALAAAAAMLSPSQAKADNPDVPVIIKGDGGTQYQSVTDVLGVVVKLGITQVGLAHVSNV